jgi:Cysteine-rich secretory protein family
MMRKGLFLSLALAAGACGAMAQVGPYGPDATGQSMPAAAEQLFAMTNQARASVGAGRVAWDPALAAAALKHCRLMVAEGQLSHRYGGEPSLEDRAGHAGAHFSLIEENIALGPDPASIQDEWLHSPGHRTNMLNPAVDRVGVAVVASRGELYAVADFSHAVQQLSPGQVEAVVGNLIRVSGVAVLRDSQGAREACTLNHGVPASLSRRQPAFIMRWQGADLSRLPPALADQLASGRFHQAAVGSCTPQGVAGDFTVYRVAVLLY